MQSKDISTDQGVVQAWLTPKTRIRFFLESRAGIKQAFSPLPPPPHTHFVLPFAVALPCESSGMNSSAGGLSTTGFTAHAN